MRSIRAGLIALLLSFVPLTAAHTEQIDAPACDAIVKACKRAGFSKKGESGSTLGTDCIRPIMLGATVANPTRPLPSVDPETVAACLAENPALGTRGATAKRPEVNSTESGPPPEPVESPPPATARSGPKPPNIIFVLTDDLSTDLIQFMPNVQEMQRDGMSFENYFVTNSVCCPSRASIFTGQLPHNHGVLTNWFPDGGYEVFHARGNEEHTFARALQAAGYRTALLGKYLNGYDPAVHGPAKGWDQWAVGGRAAYRSFDYPLNRNGQVVHYGKRDVDYVTDVLAGYAREFLAGAADRPFFLEVATFAPHTPYRPAPRDVELFPDLKAPRTPAFGARPGADAPSWLRPAPVLSDAVIGEIDEDYRKRARSVQAVDRLIGELRAMLAAMGIADETYVVFSSDNGYHMGEYSLLPGKMTPFDTDTRVPLVVVGPGVPPGTVSSALVENIDLAPTFVELGGADTLGEADGRSILPLLRGETPEWRNTVTIEHVRRNTPVDPEDPEAPASATSDPVTYHALRSRSALYVEYDDGDVAYYDLVTDPFQLNNIAGSLRVSDLQSFRAALAATRNCRGAEQCWAAQLADPGTAADAAD